MIGTFLIICMIIMLVRRFLHRHQYWVGGKFGKSRATPADVALPTGFSYVSSRDITLLGARSTEASYVSLAAFLRQNSFRRNEVMRIYQVSGFKTQIEIPATRPDYERIDAASALALLRQLPDPRFIRRLHLSDEPSFYDSWLGQKGIGLLGHATTSGLVVLYRPDQKQIQQLCTTLLHEWLHLVAFKSSKSLRSFRRADTVEPQPALDFPALPIYVSRLRNHEVWSDLGERVVGADELVARQAALAAPLHSAILWQKVESICHEVPLEIQSTRLSELEVRSSFMKTEVAPKARALAQWWK